MSTTARRSLRPAGPAARRELHVLLAALWVAEAVRPSERLILAAPMLADGTALDNRSGTFSGLEPAWGERPIGLAELLAHNLTRGGTVWVVTRRHPDGPNRLLARLRELAGAAGTAARLATAEVTALAPAGLVGSGFALTGGLALTEAGPDHADEGLVLDLGPTAEGWAGTFRNAYEGLFP
jgi:hypothetical protein